jgi:Fur family ferric uptake transcriptional regulator/Fur family peroxide stress response transcriptional regulator
MAIMGYLMEHFTHPTVDIIFNALSASIPTLSKTTVYNTLKLLAQQGAILELTIDEKNVRYDSDISLHAHFRCSGCGYLCDLPVKNPEAISAKTIGDFAITDTQLYYKGYCAKCKTKTQTQ